MIDSSPTSRYQGCGILNSKSKASEQDLHIAKALRPQRAQAHGGVAGFTQVQKTAVFPCPILTGCICKVENLYLSSLSHLSLGRGCFSFYRWSNC